MSSFLGRAGRGPGWQHARELAALWWNLPLLALQRARTDQPDERPKTRARVGFSTRHRRWRTSSNSHSGRWSTVLDFFLEPGLCDRRRDWQGAVALLLRESAPGRNYLQPLEPRRCSCRGP